MSEDPDDHAPASGETSHPGEGIPDAPRAEASSVEEHKRTRARGVSSKHQKADIPTDEKRADTKGKPKEKKQRQKEQEDPNDWRSALVYTYTTHARKIRDVTANAISILSNDARWSGVLAWDEFVSQILLLKPAPWHPHDHEHAENASVIAHLTETDVTRLQSWLVRVYELNLSPTQCYQAAEVVAKKRKIHPIRDWLRSLKWDGIPRAETWIIRHLGAEDSRYVRMVSRFFLIAAIARVMVPGEKVDTMLILEGFQGFKKSTTLRALFSKEWFSDASIDWNSKDRFEVLRGRWCVEMPELDGIAKAEVSRVKAFLSTQEDHYRRPYAKAAESVPRHCVFAGTVNPNDLGTYLRDDENRRFWPVKCTHEADLSALAAEREQLWAEALQWYMSDADTRRWWPETAEEKTLCAAEAEKRRYGEAWQSLVDAYLDSHPRTDEVTITEILKNALLLDPSKIDHGATVKAANCLARAGWVNDRRLRTDGRRETIYKRPLPAKKNAPNTAQTTHHATDTASAADKVPDPIPQHIPNTTPTEAPMGCRCVVTPGCGCRPCLCGGCTNPACTPHHEGGLGYPVDHCNGACYV